MDTTHRLLPAKRFTDVCSNDLPTLRLATANSWACPPLPCYPDSPHSRQPDSGHPSERCPAPSPVATQRRPDD